MGLSVVVQRSLLFLLVVGFFVAVVLAWFHGDAGHQRVGGAESGILMGT